MSTKKFAALTAVVLTSVVLIAAPLATAANVPTGVGGEPPTGPFVADPNGMIKVNNDGEGPIPIFMDPNAPPWIKEFVIPSGGPLVPGQSFGVWEEILLLPQPGPETIGFPPITDWHEEIVETSSGLPFIWGGSRFIIHDPLDPNAPPLVDIDGSVMSEGREVWFGPFPGVNPFDYPNGIPIWIHKELIYDGLQTLPDFNDISIIVVEYPTVPEPSSALLALVAAVGLAGFRGFRSRR